MDGFNRLSQLALVVFVLLTSVTTDAYSDSSWKTLGRFIQMSVIELPNALHAPSAQSLKINTPRDLKYCTDLFSVSCAPGDFDDGTAVMRTPGLMESSGINYLRKIFERARKDFQIAAVWDPIIQKKENRGFVEKVVEFSNLGSNTYCAGKNITSKNCLALVKHALVKVSEDLIIEQARYYYKTGEVLEEDENPTDSVVFSEPYGSLVNYARDVTKTNSGLFEQGHRRWLNRIPKASLPMMNTRLKDIRERVFPDLRSIVQEVISSAVIDPMLVDAVKLRIGLVTFDSEILCNTKHNLIGLLDPHIRIGKGRGGDPSIRTCGFFLDRNPSEYALVFHLAKKLASVVDPCALTGKIPGTDSGAAWIIPNLGLNEEEADSAFPVGNKLLSCLRSPDSAYARGTGLKIEPTPTPTPTPLPVIGKTPPPIPEPTPGERIALHCLKSDNDIYDDDGFLRPKSDQILDAFSDWVATEALARWVEVYRSMDLERMQSDRTKVRNGYSNVFRSFCRVGVDQSVFRDNLHPFPALDRRINGILNSNPRVREQMGCPIFQGDRACTGLKIDDWSGNPFRFDGESETTAPKPFD